MVVTNEQIERSKARKKAIQALEHNTMCYDCKNFGKSCKGSMNKIYSGCIHKEVDESKPSICTDCGTSKIVETVEISTVCRNCPTCTDETGHTMKGWLILWQKLNYKE